MKTYFEVLKENIANNQYIEVKMKAAAAVIRKIDENGKAQILLIQRSEKDHWPNHWEFPRGKCDHGNESIDSCVKREVKEETGLDIDIIGMIDTFEYLADGGKRLTKCFNYLCKMKDENQKIKLSHEHQDYKWISEVGQAEMLVLPDQKKTIEKVLNDEPIVNYPRNNFTKNNRIEEYLRKL